MAGDRLGTAPLRPRPLYRAVFCLYLRVHRRSPSKCNKTKNKIVTVCASLLVMPIPRPSMLLPCDSSSRIRLTFVECLRGSTPPWQLHGLCLLLNFWIYGIIAARSLFFLLCHLFSSASPPPLSLPVLPSCPPTTTTLATLVLVLSISLLLFHPLQCSVFRPRRLALHVLYRERHIYKLYSSHAREHTLSHLSWR